MADPKVSPLDRVRAALDDATENARLCDPNGERARVIRAPEDGPIRDLCERIGYGAVMDSAARSWRLRDPVAAFTIGPCAETVRAGLSRLADGLRALDETAARLARLEAVADAARAYGALRQCVLDAMTQGLDDDAEALAFQLTEAGDALDARVRALDAPTGDAAPAPTPKETGNA